MPTLEQTVKLHFFKETMDVHQHSHWSETTLENLIEENGNVEYIKISTEAAKGINAFN